MHDRCSISRWASCVGPPVARRVRRVVYAVGVWLPNGTRTTVVLRRGGTHGHLETPQRTAIEFRTLAVLVQAGAPASRPLLLDADGNYVDRPSIVLRYEGRPIVSPRDAIAWVDGLAGAHVQGQAVTRTRFDLAMMHGTEMADAFLSAHCARAGGPVRDDWFFDPLIGLDDALATFRSWIPGYLDLGLTHLTEEVVEARLRAFRTESLRRAGTPPNG